MSDLILLPQPELVIVSLNTELYMLKCLVFTLQVENEALRGRLARLDEILHPTLGECQVSRGAAA